MRPFLYIPAIDIMAGNCVRLTQGDYQQVKQYSYDPVQVARSFEKEGADMIHLVDLDGAKMKKIVNWSTIRQVCQAVSIPVEVGGGIRTKKDIEDLLELGASRIILGSLAVENPDLISEFITAFGSDRVVIGVDVLNGVPKTAGWLEQGKITMEELISDMQKRRVQTIVVTDISRDGMMNSPNFHQYEQLVSLFPQLQILASGGVSCEEDISKLRSIGVHGAILGKSLYEGKIILSQLTRSLCSPNESFPA